MQLCFNCSGSHILELLLSLLPKCIGSTDGEEDEDSVKSAQGKKDKEKDTVPPAEEIILNVCDVSLHHRLIVSAFPSGHLHSSHSNSLRGGEICCRITMPATSCGGSFIPSLV